MAEQNESRGFGRRLKGFFVAEEQLADDAGNGALEGELSELGSGAQAPDLELGGPSAVAPSDPSASAESIADTDFPTLYARVITDGDSNTDPVLEAYSGMVTMEETARRTAIGAMLKGLRADAAAIAATLGNRLRVVQAAAKQVKETAAAAHAERTSALTALESETREQVAALKAQIAALESTLDAEVQRVQTAQAEDQGKLAAYDERVRAEQLRLGQLAEFLRSLTASAKPKTSK